MIILLFFFIVSYFYFSSHHAYDSKNIKKQLYYDINKKQYFRFVPIVHVCSQFKN